MYVIVRMNSKLNLVKSQQSEKKKEKKKEKKLTKNKQKTHT